MTHPALSGRTHHSTRQRLLSGRHYVAVLAISGCFALSLACDNRATPASPGSLDVLVHGESSTDIDFHFAAGDAVDARRQQSFHSWAVQYFAVVLSRRLTYNKYRDRSHLQRVSGQLANGWADAAAFTIHSVWESDPHEATHIYTAQFGRPSDFFNEGIAVALAIDPLSERFVPLWNSTPVDTVAAGMLTARTLPRLSFIVDTAAFRQLSDQVSYPTAGSFVGHLLNERGIALVRRFFAVSTRGDDRATIEARFLEVFGRSLQEAEADWLAALSRRSQSLSPSLPNLIPRRDCTRCQR